MAKLIAMYGMPADPAAFDRCCCATYVPLAKKVPGLRHYDVTTGAVTTRERRMRQSLIATLAPDSLADIQAARASPEGKATVADLASFATGGVSLCIGDNKPVCSRP
jgi:uncharacterized protein (TIGR02118 family)